MNNLQLACTLLAAAAGAPVLTLGLRHNVQRCSTPLMSAQFSPPPFFSTAPFPAARTGVGVPHKLNACKLATAVHALQHFGWDAACYGALQQWAGHTRPSLASARHDGIHGGFSYPVAGGSAAIGAATTLALSLAKAMSNSLAWKVRLFSQANQQAMACLRCCHATSCTCTYQNSALIHKCTLAGYPNPAPLLAVEICCGYYPAHLEPAWPRCARMHQRTCIIIAPLPVACRLDSNLCNAHAGVSARFLLHPSLPCRRPHSTAELDLLPLPSHGTAKDGCTSQLPPASPGNCVGVIHAAAAGAWSARSGR